MVRNWDSAYLVSSKRVPTVLTSNPHLCKVEALWRNAFSAATPLFLNLWMYWLELLLSVLEVRMEIGGISHKRHTRYRQKREFAYTCPRQHFFDEYCDRKQHGFMEFHNDWIILWIPCCERELGWWFELGWKILAEVICKTENFCNFVLGNHSDKFLLML